jgi:DNA modification methylase
VGSAHLRCAELDPFMGSGSVGVAALRLGRNFAGTDVCAEAISVATGRFGTHAAVAAEPQVNELGQAKLAGID